MNKHITDMISRLERQADYDNFNAGDIEPHIQQCRDRGLSGEADHIEREVERFRQHAADLRAAAAAVRLVAECREALVKAKHTSKGWYEHTTEALAAIADWEGKHGQ